MLGTLFYVTPLDDSRMVECVPGRNGEGMVRDENRHSVPVRPRVGIENESTQREGAGGVCSGEVSGVWGPKSGGGRPVAVLCSK